MHSVKETMAFGKHQETSEFWTHKARGSGNWTASIFTRCSRTRRQLVFTSRTFHVVFVLHSLVFTFHLILDSVVCQFHLSAHSSLSGEGSSLHLLALVIFLCKSWNLRYVAPTARRMLKGHQLRMIVLTGSPISQWCGLDTLKIFPGKYCG